MSKKNEQEQNPQMSDEEQWESINDDADETCSLVPESEANGLDLRYQVKGVYRCTKIVDGKFGPCELHILHVVENGADYNLGVWGTKHASMVMSRVPPGTKIRMTWGGEKDTGKGNPMKMTKIDIPKGTRMVCPSSPDDNHL